MFFSRLSFGEAAPYLYGVFYTAHKILMRCLLASVAGFSANMGCQILSEKFLGPRLEVPQLSP